MSRASELSAASLGILQEMAASLVASCQALLTRNLEAMENGIEQQQRLQRALAILWKADTLWDFATTNRPTPRQKTPCEAFLLPTDLRGDTQLLNSVAHVLHLGRVQKALLVRAQQSLRMIGYLAAGAQANYQPPVQERREGTSCQA
jgi:hypothetical protein